MTPPTDPEAMRSLKGLAHPLRVQILDTLSAYGPATASALAERLHESSGATSYHLRQLEKHGFVTDDPERGTGRERWWKRVPGSIELSPEPDAGPAEREASQMVLAEWYRTRAGRLQNLITHGDSALSEEWVNASRLTTSNLRLTRDQSIELHTALGEVLDTFREKYRDQDVPGSRPVQIHIDVFALIDGVETPDPAPEGNQT